MADVGGILTQALLGGTAEAGRGMQRRQGEDRASSVKAKRDQALESIRAGNEAKMQTRKEEEAERGRAAKAEESRLDREARSEQSKLDRESREKIASEKNADPLGGEDNESMAADDYAEQRVKEQAGFFETDATSFKDFGGSRAKAKEFYRNEFLQGRSGEGQQQPKSGLTSEKVTTETKTEETSYSPVQTRLIDAVREKNPNATDEQIIAALKNNDKYSKYFE